MYVKQNTKYAKQNTQYVNWIPKYWLTLFCRETIFVANLRTFLAYLLQALKYGGGPNDKYQVCEEVCPYYGLKVINFAESAFKPLYII